MSEARNEVERNWGEHSPSYYRAMAIQPTDYIVANKIEYLPASVVKYASRAGRKPGEPALKDAKKCLAFAKRWVAELEAEQAAPRAPAREDVPETDFGNMPQPTRTVEVPHVEPEPALNGQVDARRVEVCR